MKQTLLNYPIREFLKSQHPLLIHESLGESFFRELLKESEIHTKNSLLSLDGKLAVHDEKYLDFRGILDGILAMTCSRCLENANHPLHISLHCTYLPIWEIREPSFHGNYTLEASRMDDLSTTEDFYTHDGESVNLFNYIREQILLSIPIVVLCKEDCLGLCQFCGSNRNQKPCACNQDDLSSMRSKLTAIKNKL